MLAKRIIPCLDVTAGRVVKGTNFVDLRDAGDPVEIARRYDAQGADEVTFLDITASSDQRDIILHIVEACAEQVFIPLTVGGGVRAIADVRRLLNAGADKVSMNTAAVQNPDLVAEASAKVGNQCIVVAIDAKQSAPGSWEVFTHGGRNGTGMCAIEWARKVQQLGAGEILLTSMDRDGTKAGFGILGDGWHQAMFVPADSLQPRTTGIQITHSRTSIPRSRMRSLAWRTVYSPKWKIEAASTASAWPSETPSAR